MCRQQGQRDGGLEQRGCAYGAGVQRRLEGPLVLEDGIHSALQLGQRDSMPLWWGRRKGPCWQIRVTSKLLGPALVSAWKEGFSGLKWRSRNLRPSA